MKNNKNRLLGLMIFLIAVTVFPLTAYATDPADSDTSAALTVCCIHDSKPLSGVVFDLYKVADADDTGAFTVTEAFSGYSVSLDQQTVEGWRALAQTVAPYAIRDGIPAVRQGSTDSSGRARFTELGTGMYLVYGHRYENGDFVYIPEPFFVILPGVDGDGGRDYDVEANCKGMGYDDPPETTAVRVLKVWDDEGHETNRPKDVEVQLLSDGAVYDEVTLNAENNWRFAWQDLSSDRGWSVVEKTVPDNYATLVSREGVTFVLTNTYTPAFTTVEVEKVWDDRGHESSRPKEIEIQLLRDGQVSDTAVLNDSSDWACSWSDLERGRDWSVKEKNVPAGYRAVIRQDGGRFTVTNVYSATPGAPSLPQTGQLWWPIPVFVSVGLVCWLIGFLQWKARKKRDE